MSMENSSDSTENRTIDLNCWNNEPILFWSFSKAYIWPVKGLWKIKYLVVLKQMAHMVTTVISTVQG